MTKMPDPSTLSDVFDYNETTGQFAPAPVQRAMVSDTPSAALEFDDEVIAYAQEIVDDREANGCKVYVSDVIDALRAALEASHE